MTEVNRVEALSPVSASQSLWSGNPGDFGDVFGTPPSDGGMGYLETLAVSNLFAQNILRTSMTGVVQMREIFEYNSDEESENEDE
jgi:hypothetical protein